MLPPDNFQEVPEPVVAHRTSPTNIGLYLLSIACARDFGWIGTLEAVERLEATLATMARMAKHRGHFFNWYDTRDLRPLDPQYVSSVDSGNLAGHLIALANACREWRDARARRSSCVSKAWRTHSTWSGRGSPVATTCASRRRCPGGGSTTRSDGWRRPASASARGAGIEQRLAGLSDQAAILADAAREIALEEKRPGRGGPAVLGGRGPRLHREPPARSRRRARRLA